MTDERKTLALAVLFAVAGLLFLGALCFGVTVYQHSTPDGKYLVEVCDCYRQEVFEVRARLLSSGPWRHIGAQVPTLEDVRQDVIVSNERVAWVQGETASGIKWALRSARVDGTGTTTLLSHPSPQNGQGFDFPIQSAWNGEAVRFRSDPEVDEQLSWWVVRIDGGRIWQEIFTDGFNGGVTRWR